MADVNFKTVRVLLNTVIGTQDITISGFGTPKAAIFYYDFDTADDTIKVTTRNSVGFTDGTNQAVCATSSGDGLSTSESSRSHNESAVIREMQSNLTIVASASFNSWITDGVRINITNASALNRFVTVVLINGSDVTNAKVETKALLSTSEVITSIGFESDLVLPISVGLSSITTAFTNLISSQGVAVNDGSDSNYGLYQFSQDGQATANTGQYTSTAGSVGQFFNNTLTWEGAIGSYTSTGFTVSASAATGSDFISYLALKFSNSPLIDVLMEDSPTATGSKVFGATSSAPNFSLLLTGNNSTLNTAQSNLGFSQTVSDATNQFSSGICDEDNVSTTVADTISKSGGLTQLLNGSKQFDSSFTGFTSSGVEFNFTTVDATPRKWISLLIGDGATGATITGTAVPTQTEADVVIGGKTIILTLTGDTFVTGTSSLDGIAAGSLSDIPSNG